MNKAESRKDLIGKLLILSATLVWGSSFVILKDTLDSFGNGHFTFFILACRFLIASVVLLLFSVKRFKNFNKRILVHGVILGLVLFLAYAIQTVALKFTTPSKNAFLTETYCILVPFILWIFFKKKPEIKNFIAAFICLAGVIVIAFFGRTETASNEILGDGLTVLCGVFYALQMIFNSRYKEDDSMLLLCVELTTVTILCLLTSCAVEIPKYSSDLSFDFDSAWRIAYLGVFATFYAQFAQLYGQKYTSATTTSIILCFEGVFSVMFEFIFGYNNLNVFIIIGFTLILSTLFITEIDFKSVAERVNARKKARLSEKETKDKDEESQDNE